MKSARTFIWFSGCLPHENGSFLRPIASLRSKKLPREREPRSAGGAAHGNGKAREHLSAPAPLYSSYTSLLEQMQRGGREVAAPPPALRARDTPTTTGSPQGIQKLIGLGLGIKAHVANARYGALNTARVAPPQPPRRRVPPRTPQIPAAASTRFDQESMRVGSRGV
jgi:hypothetical protein